MNRLHGEGETVMPRVSTAEIVSHAASDGSGAGSFNIILIEQAEAIAAGAEQAGVPVILQISENCVRYHGGLAPLSAAAHAIAEAARVPVAVQLDHATSVDLVAQGVAAGFSSVMFDASALPYADNVETSAAVVRRCHDAGVWVEAELGEIGGKDGVHSPRARTDPGEAAAYVAATGVDALAVAVGTSHAMLTRDAALDFGLIARLRDIVPVPLVLHGSSGVADADLQQAVAMGITKVNIATRLNKVFTAAVRSELSTDNEVVDLRRYLTRARAAVALEAERLLRVITLK
jgi:fructose-bisphosphate aldolase class II